MLFVRLLPLARRFGQSRCIGALPPGVLSLAVRTRDLLHIDRHLVNYLRCNGTHWDHRFAGTEAGNPTRFVGGINVGDGSVA